MNLFTMEQKVQEEHLLVDLFDAYIDARRHKRAKRTQLAFEFEHEKRLLRLHKQIINRRYKPLRSTAFISTHPVLREVFAAHFQDRVVHHLIFAHLSPLCEREFIQDSYSCRKTKGTHYGISRIYDAIFEESEGYSKDAYILKLDIQGYFYAISKDILFASIQEILDKHRDSLSVDRETLEYLIRETIYVDPTKNVKIYSDDKNWQILPKNKSLFYAKRGCGLPIGNLTSQLFSNIYMNIFDHYIVEELGVEYYGRYVDDFVLIQKDKQYLLSLIEKIRVFLKNRLRLTLHPKKIYLQHISKGVVFLGAYLKPHVQYIETRTKTNFYKHIHQINLELSQGSPSDTYLKQVQSSINSYLGTLIHFSTYRLRKKILAALSDIFYHYFLVDKNMSKVILKDYY